MQDSCTSASLVLWHVHECVLALPFEAVRESVERRVEGISRSDTATETVLTVGGCRLPHPKVPTDTVIEKKVRYNAKEVFKRESSSY